jgi:hypothetical protein
VGCCGKIAKVARIAEGNFLHLMNKMQMLPEKTCAGSNARLDECRRCDNQTWLTWDEFWEWVDENGGKKKFFAEIDGLETWPLLPDNKYKPGLKLFCRICKCWLPAKSYVKEEMCPLAKWPD